MTRPIGEPSHLGRTGASQAAIRQLQRRPAPLTSPSWAVVVQNTDQTVTATSTDFIGWETFIASDPDSFGTNTSGSAFSNTPGDTRLVTNITGLILVVARVEFQNATPAYEHQCTIQRINQQGGSSLGGFGNAAATWSNLIDGAAVDVGDVSIGVSDGGASGVSGALLSVFNGDSVSRDVLRSSLTMFVWPASISTVTQVYP